MARDMPQDLVERYHRAIKILEGRGVRPPQARELAFERVSRVWSWRRRGKYDAQECTCGTMILWRKEDGRVVPITADGKAHACQ